MKDVGMVFVTFPRFNLTKVITQTGNTSLSLNRHQNIFIESGKSGHSIPTLDLDLLKEHFFDLLPLPVRQGFD
jgi:hypothetical protein